MKHKILSKVLAVGLSALTMLSTVTTALGANIDTVKSGLSSDFTFVYNGAATYSGATLGNFTVKGVSDDKDTNATRQAFCIENSKSDPSRSTLNKFEQSNDEKLAKALYYGWVADQSNSVVESVYGSSASNKTARMVVTSATLSQLYSGQSYGNSGSAASQKSKLVSIANDSSKTIPNNKISVTDSNLSVSIKNNKQVTQTTQLKGYSGNSITIKVPANVTLVNETQNKKVTNGNATIKVNDKFHLEAPLNYSGNFDSGILTGILYDFKVYIAKSKSSSTQDIATYCWVENKTSTVQIKATFKSQLGSLEIIKDSSNHSLTDNNTDCYSLKGAVFTVTNTSTNKQYTVTTNTKVDDGSATVKYKGVLSDIPIGEYTIKETQAPKGYALSTETKTVSVTGGSSATSVTIKNEPQNDPVLVVVNKTDDNGKMLSGAEFTIRFYKGYFTEAEIASGEAESSFKRYWTIKTDADGYARLANEYLVDSNNDFYYSSDGNENPCLPLGTVTIQETKAPDGYVIDDTLYVRQITSTGSSESVFTFNVPIVPNDHEEGELKIVKTSEGDIAGIKFNLYKGNSVNANNLIGTYTTDSNGLITKTVDTGTYTVEEIVDSQYQPQEPQTITVTKNNTSSNPATVKFHNQFKTGKLKIVKTSEAIQNADGTTTPGKIEGITFEIYTSSNDLIGTYTTDANGLILEDTLGEFKPGTYRIHEVPVDGYRQLQDKTIEIVANKTTTVKFNNSPQGGTLKILKNVDYSVYSKTAEPFIFKVEGLSNDFYDEVLIYPNKRSKSDDGTLVVRPAVIDLPESGAYKVTEVLTDEQKLYWEEPEQESQIVVVDNNEVKEVTFNNHEKTGSLLIQKTADDGFVEGVTFELTGYSYAGVSVHHIVSTDENGKFEFSELPVGEYILREISSPSPYIYETLGDITVKVEDGKLTTANVHNDNIGRKMQIVKTSDDGEVANIEFKVTCAERNFSKIYKTDEYGIITTEELDAGTYTVEEINTPNKYELQSAKTINIEYPKTESEAEQVYSVKFHNVLKDGTAKIVKTSASGKVEGFEFNITGTAYNGEEISLTGLKTNSNGLITEKIPQGTYTIEEINVPEFYVTPDPQIIEIRAGETSTVEFYNDYSRGDGTVIKTSDDGKVEGLKFRLYGTADCGENVDVISTTNSEGIAKFERILIGTYTLEEVDTPEQYEAFEPIQVAISEDFTAEVTAHNSYREVPVKIVKTSETGVISNIKFQVVNNETGFDETYITDENGLISLNLLPGTYQVTELEVAGYYIPQETKTLTVAPYNSETDVATVSFENILKKGTVRVQKTADDGIIEGVEFRIFGQSEAGTEVNLTATTNSDGIAVFDNIPIGNEYWLMELNQPDRYIAVIEQNFDITWNETTTMLVENNLKKGEISTTAKDKDTNNNYAYANTTTTIIDTVSYKGIGTNTEYTVKGVLMDKSTGEPFEVNGEQVTATKTFTTSETGTGTVDVEFIFDSSALIGKSVVVFEQLYYNSVELASHKDIDDEGQTVTFKDPKIGTTAKDVLTDGHDSYVNEETTIVDTVEYENLIVGKEYKLIGKLMDKATGEVVQIGGEEVTSELIFIPETENGAVDVTFNFDSTNLIGKDVVVFEYLYFGDNEIAVHTDIDDEGQTITFRDVDIKTTAVDNDTKTHSAYVNELTTIIDTVTFENLIVGKEYTVKGMLMNKSTGEPLEVNGEQVTAERTFTAEAENGTINIEFTFDSSALQSEAIVVFEHLYYEEIEIASHTDLNDDDQTVEFKSPKIGTTAKDKDTQEHNAFVNKETTIIDTVEYENLIVGKEYTIKGYLVDKVTGSPIVIDDVALIAETTFTAESENGTVDVTFTFDSSSLIAKDIVVFESLYFDENEIATHADINDNGQTIKFVEPKIGTTAKDKATGTHNAKVSKTTTIIDTVTFENLIVGKEYTVKGTLMVKETGQTLVVNGNEITAEKAFTAEVENGSIDIEFTFDSTALEGKSVVAFETIYFNDLEIATHSDLSDKGQTVTFEKPDEIESSGTPEQTESTGTPDQIDSTGKSDTTESTAPYTGSTVPYVLISLFISSVGIIILNRKRKNN